MIILQRPHFYFMWCSLPASIHALHRLRQQKTWRWLYTHDQAMIVYWAIEWPSYTSHLFTNMALCLTKEQRIVCSSFKGHHPWGYKQHGHGLESTCFPMGYRLCFKRHVRDRETFKQYLWHCLEHAYFMVTKFFRIYDFVLILFLFSMELRIKRKRLPWFSLN